MIVAVGLLSEMSMDKVRGGSWHIAIYYVISLAMPIEAEDD